MVLRDMGKAGLAVLVLGTAACADGSSERQPTTSADDDGNVTTDAEATSTTRDQPTSTTDAGSGFDWQRVNLGFVSAYILYRAGEAVMVDTGVDGREAAISAALSEAGLGWDAVGHVVITHKHPDHQGSLEAVLTEAPEAAWYAGPATCPRSPLLLRGSSSPTANPYSASKSSRPGHTPGHVSVERGRCYSIG